MDDDQCEKSTSEKADLNPAQSAKIAKIGQKRESAGSQSNLLFFEQHVPKKQRIESDEREQE